MSASIILRDVSLYEEAMPNCVESYVADDVDVLVQCPCGTPFYIYVPDTPYRCDVCGRVYRVMVTLKLYTGGEGGK